MGHDGLKLGLSVAIAFIYIVACSREPTQHEPDAGDTDTDPYAVPEATIEEPPPFAECEIEWVKTYEFPVPDVQTSSRAIGMTQLANGNYLVVGGVFVPYDGNYGLVMEVASDGEMLRHALLGPNVTYYQRVFETEEGFMLFGGSTESGNYHCVMHLVSQDFEIIWDGGDEIYKCVDVERREDGSFVFSGSADGESALGRIDTDNTLSYSLDFDLEGGVGEMVLLGQDQAAVIVKHTESEYPYYATPKLALANGLEFTELITYEYTHSTGFDSIAVSDDDHLLISGGSFFYRASYILYMTEEGHPIWAKYVGYENGPYVANLVSDSGQYLFASGSADWKAYAGRLDEQGSILWHYLHDEPGEISVGGGMKDTNDSGIIVYGNYTLTSQQAWLMKIKSNENCY